jgi:ribonucleoside-diphosphate reductase alpha chain
MLVTERFKLNPLTQAALQREDPQFGFGLLGAATYYRTYSRIKPDGSQEGWADTVIRVVEGALSILKTHRAKNNLSWDEMDMQSLATKFAANIFEFKFLPPGRGLWVGGTEHVYNSGSMAHNNCAFVSVKKLSHDASWCMNALMLGVGVGYDTYRGTINLKEPAQFTTEIYTIPDSRQGWVTSVEKLIQSYELGKGEIKFDYSKIRPKGSPIKGFGGIASGPKPLQELHESLRVVLSKRARKEISSVRCISDTINLIARCVVSGNVRRSALIALGRPDDDEFLNLKNWNLPENKERCDFQTGWAHTANNSVVLESAEDFDYLPKIAPLVSINAEPGVLNLMSVQKYARRGEKKRDRAIGVNPCGEIALEDKELCNLVEVFPTRCRKENEFFEALNLATRFASIVSLLETESDENNEVVERNRRIGVSISGIVDWLTALPRKSDFVRLMNEGYEIVKETNARHAIDNKVPASVRLTTVKPSGTISLLAGVSAGMHHPIFRRYIRRMKVDSASPLVEILTDAGVPYEPDNADPKNTYIFEFPVEQKNIKAQDEVSLQEHGMRLMTISRFWADNAASNTSTFKATLYEDSEGNEVSEFMHPDDARQRGYKVKERGEEESIEAFLTYLIPEVKSVSMSPTSQSRMVFPQSPYESITVAKLEQRQALLKPVDWSKFGGSDGQDNRFCSNDSCEI